ncbi:MAG: antitoxin, partial [Bacteroidetes bacterium RIFCSPLOWO2_12_FULL_31_6]
MIDKSRKYMIQYRIDRAKDTIAEANAMIEKCFWNAAVNRLYYACYYAVIALLLKHNFKTQTHSGVCRMFGLHFVKTGFISKEMGRFYSELFDQRQTGDYNDFIEYNKETLDYLLP